MKDDVTKKIFALRKRIDAADRVYLRALKGRLDIAEKIGHIKIKHGMPLYQKARWKEMIEARAKIAQTMGLDGKFARRLFTEIHAEALRIQRQLLKRKKRRKK